MIRQRMISVSAKLSRVWVLGSVRQIVIGSNGVGQIFINYKRD